MRTQRERERDAGRDCEIARKETETRGVKRIWGSRLKGAPPREGRGSADSEEGRYIYILVEFLWGWRVSAPRRKDKGEE